jgi:hypothetical protein
MLVMARAREQMTLESPYSTREEQLK